MFLCYDVSVCAFVVHLGTRLWILLHFGSGFRDGGVPATGLIVVFVLSGYGPGNAQAALFGCCTWLPCEGGSAGKYVACGLPFGALVPWVGHMLGWVSLGRWT